MRAIQITATLCMAAGIACGAFGAHALRDIVPQRELLIWEKGVFYQLIHALAALLITSATGLQISDRVRRAIGWLFLGSLAIFSGTLYALVLSGMHWLGAITPVGGAGFILGWLLLAYQLVKQRCRSH